MCGESPRPCQPIDLGPPLSTAIVSSSRLTRSCQSPQARWARRPPTSARSSHGLTGSGWSCLAVSRTVTSAVRVGDVLDLLEIRGGGHPAPSGRLGSARLRKGGGTPGAESRRRIGRRCSLPGASAAQPRDRAPRRRTGRGPASRRRDRRRPRSRWPVPCATTWSPGAGRPTPGAIQGFEEDFEACLAPRHSPRPSAARVAPRISSTGCSSRIAGGSRPHGRSSATGRCRRSCLRR